MWEWAFCLWEKDCFLAHLLGKDDIGDHWPTLNLVRLLCHQYPKMHQMTCPIGISLLTFWRFLNNNNITHNKLNSIIKMMQLQLSIWARKTWRKNLIPDLSLFVWKGTKKLECVSPNGTGRRVIQNNLNYPFSIVGYVNHFYHTDWRRYDLLKV